MIKHMMFRMLSLNEKYRFAEEVISALDAIPCNVPELQPLVDRIKANFEAVKEASLGLSHPEFAAARRAGDALRDILLSGRAPTLAGNCAVMVLGGFACLALASAIFHWRRLRGQRAAEGVAA